MTRRDIPVASELLPFAGRIWRRLTDTRASLWDI